jgi:subtilase family serine protease
VCPAGDSCPPAFNGYSGDIEVDADIEMSLAISPANRHIVVYNAPNDETGQTSLDEYSVIANQDIADTTSSSWGVCENDVTPAYTEAENLIFEQMAAQGQSLFTSSGDTGAFGCIRTDLTTVVDVGDPGSQPWITSVGGTSFGNFNPGQNPDPSYPRPGTETVWNPLGLCNTSANEFGLSGLDWCGATGASGGGTSQYWGRPSYQTGPGVNNPFTTYANGSTHCTLAPRGTPCREVPDISMNADQYTPYSEYCTGNANTPFSTCGEFSDDQNPPGWFGIGGTSLSSPFMSAIIADRDSYTRRRTGNANQLLYALFNSGNPNQYFHDITGIHQFPNNNGLFPTTPSYDLATGIGTAIMAPIITAR